MFIEKNICWIIQLKNIILLWNHTWLQLTMVVVISQPLWVKTNNILSLHKPLVTWNDYDILSYSASFWHSKALYSKQNIDPVRILEKYLRSRKLSSWPRSEWILRKQREKEIEKKGLQSKTIKTRLSGIEKELEKISLKYRFCIFCWRRWQKTCVL